MAGDTVITVVGNLTADPELRFTASGAAVANFTVASTPRTFDRATGEWKDGEALFLRCNIWRQAAENVAESLTRGSRVIVSGRLKQRSFETKEGEKRTVIELEVDEIGPSLRYATAKVNRAQRSDGGGGGGYGSGGGGGGGGGGYGNPVVPGRPPAPGRRPVGQRPAGRRPAATPTSRRSDDPALRATPPFLTLTYSSGELIMAKPPVRKPKKKVCAFCKENAQPIDYKDTTLLRRVHLRPRQDPGPPGHRQLHPAPARHRDRGQERPRGRPAAVHLDRSLIRKETTS